MGLQAFFDESGSTHDSDFVCVGGVIATADAWSTASTAWTNALSAVDVPSLHMREFAHSRGAYAGWTEDCRQALLSSLLTILRDAHVTVLGAAMPMNAWNSLSAQERGAFRDPYFCCLQEVFHGTLVHAELVGRDSVELIVADHPEFGVSAEALWNTYCGYRDLAHRASGFSRQSPRCCAPLQAADLVAYEVRKSCDMIARGETTLRWPFEQLLDTDPMLKFIDGDYLRRQVRGLPL